MHFPDVRAGKRNSRPRVRNRCGEYSAADQRLHSKSAPPLTIASPLACPPSTASCISACAPPQTFPRDEPERLHPHPRSGVGKSRCRHFLFFSFQLVSKSAPPDFLPASSGGALPKPHQHLAAAP